MLATAAFLAVRAKLASREREKAQESERHSMSLEDHRADEGSTRPSLGCEDDLRSDDKRKKVNCSRDFVVGSHVRVRDADGEWQSGTVLSFDADGKPLVKVLGYDSAFSWDEYRRASTSDRESSDSNNSADVGFQSDPRLGRRYNADYEDDEKKNSGGWKSWFRRDGLGGSSNHKSQVGIDDFCGDEPESMKEYFSRMKKKREDQENSSQTSKMAAPNNSSPQRSRHSTQSSLSPSPKQLNFSRKPTWLFRSALQSDSDEWNAFRSVDQKRLDEAQSNSTLVRGRRWEAQAEKRTMKPLYWDGPSVLIRQCLWCWKDGKVWKPVGSEEDEALIEEEFQAYASKVSDPVYGKSTPSQDIKVANMTITFSYNLSTGVISVHPRKEKEGGSWTLGIKDKLFKTEFKRGWEGKIEKDNEVDEQPCSHLILIVHGIGESLFSRDDVAWPSFLECTDFVREIGWDLSATRKQGKCEFIPVEWYAQCAAKKREVGRANLPSVPKIRAFCNEVVLDALMYLTPRWRNVILYAVVERMATTVSTFVSHNPEWSPDRVSVVGHSLGSVILFDLLSSLDLSPEQQLPFTPRNFVALGSPAAYMLDTAEESPEWLNTRLAQMKLQPRGLFRNCFHPNDPIAYRMEPCLAPCAHQSSAPKLTTFTHKQKFRIATLEKQKESALEGQDLDKWVALKTEIASLQHASPSQGEDTKLSSDDTFDETFPPPLFVTSDDANKSKTKGKDSPLCSENAEDELNLNNFGASESTRADSALSLSGNFCQECYDNRIPQWDTAESATHRIDYCLERSPTRKFREYFSALKAHTSYFWERDVILFIMETVRESEESTNDFSAESAGERPPKAPEPSSGLFDSVDTGDDIDDAYVAPPAAEVIAEVETANDD